MTLHCLCWSFFILGLTWKIMALTIGTSQPTIITESREVGFSPGKQRHHQASEKPYYPGSRIA